MSRLGPPLFAVLHVPPQVVKQLLPSRLKDNAAARSVVDAARSVVDAARSGVMAALAKSAALLKIGTTQDLKESVKAAKAKEERSIELEAGVADAAEEQVGEVAGGTLKTPRKTSAGPSLATFLKLGPELSEPAPPIVNGRLAVPDGAKPGTWLDTQLPGGQMIRVQVPSDAAPGNEICFVDPERKIRDRPEVQAALNIAGRVPKKFENAMDGLSMSGLYLIPTNKFMNPFRECIMQESMIRKHCSPIYAVLLPVLFVAFLWALWAVPTVMLSKIPPLWGPGENTTNTTEYATRTLSIPEVQQSVQGQTLQESFRLGAYTDRWVQLDCNSNVSACGPMLGAADGATEDLLEALHFNITEEKVLNLYHAPDLLQAIFNVTNVCYAIGGLLILLSIRSLRSKIQPVVERGCVLIFSPLFNFLNLIFKCLSERLKIVFAFAIFFVGFTLVALWNLVVWLLDNLMLIDIVLFYFVLMLAAQASRYPSLHGSSASMLGLAAGLLALPCFLFALRTTTLRFLFQTTLLKALGLLLWANVLTPLALIHSSSIIGFAAVLSAYMSMTVALGAGFAGVEGGEVYQRMLGEEDAKEEAEMKTPLRVHARVAAASVVLLVAFESLSLVLEPAILAPFAPAVAMLGLQVLFGALLLLAGDLNDGLGSVVVEPQGSNVPRSTVVARQLPLLTALGILAMVAVVTPSEALNDSTNHRRIHVQTSSEDMWAVAGEFSALYGMVVITALTRNAPKVFLYLGLFSIGVGLLILADWLSSHLEDVRQFASSITAGVLGTIV